MKLWFQQKNVLYLELRWAKNELCQLSKCIFDCLLYQHWMYVNHNYVYMYVDSSNSCKFHWKSLIFLFKTTVNYKYIVQSQIYHLYSVKYSTQIKKININRHMFDKLNVSCRYKIYDKSPLFFCAIIFHFFVYSGSFTLAPLSKIFETKNFLSLSF